MGLGIGIAFVWTRTVSVSLGRTIPFGGYKSDGALVILFYFEPWADVVMAVDASC